MFHSRVLADGQSLTRVMNIYYREERKAKEANEAKEAKEERWRNIEEQEKDNRRKSRSPMKKKPLPPGSPKKRRIIGSPQKRLTRAELEQTNRYMAVNCSSIKIINNTLGQIACVCANDNKNGHMTPAPLFKIEKI